MAPRPRAVLFFHTGDPEHNTTRPSDSAAAAAWDLQGEWGVFLGTPISPRHFLTAKHVGGQIGQFFQFQGRSYRTLAYHDDPEADLRIWVVAESFPAFASLFRGSDEPGRRLLVFGRGTRRGSEVRIDNAPPGRQLKGWTWGPLDGRIRWGFNRVEGIRKSDNDGGFDLLRAAFDADGCPEECHLSVGDSGGGLFIEDGTAWLLAGINHSVDGPYRSNPGAPRFDAALFDQTGLESEQDGDWVARPEHPHAEPGNFYSTRISSRLDWIDSILALPPHESVALLGGADIQGPFSTEEALIDPTAGRIILPLPESTRFYRIQGEKPHAIRGIRRENAQLIIEFD